MYFIIIIIIDVTIKYKKNVIFKIFLLNAFKTTQKIYIMSFKNILIKVYKLIKKIYLKKSIKNQYMSNKEVYKKPINSIIFIIYTISIYT